MLDVDRVALPVRPATVSTGLHEAKSGIFVEIATVMVLLSQGNGELWAALHIVLRLSSLGVRMNNGLPSLVEFSAGFIDIQVVV